MPAPGPYSGQQGAAHAAGDQERAAFDWAVLWVWDEDRSIPRCSHQVAYSTRQ